MTEIDIVLLTESRYIDANPSESYKKDVLKEDHVLSSALEKRGFSTLRVSWTDPDFDWSSAKFLMFRSIWDYFYHFEQFKLWLQNREGEGKFINVLPQVRWNVDKHYLKDLEDKGISIVPTKYLEAGNALGLTQVFNDHPSDKLIIKPAVSGTARHTYLITRSNVSAHERIFNELIGKESMLVQPFLKNIADQGEVSLVLFEGNYSHAILKKAKPGDFRVQGDFGGTLHAYNPSDEEIHFAKKVVETCDPIPVYARVDVARDDNNEMVLVELELIEPDLLNPGSEEKLAQAVKNHISMLELGGI
jgi:hypothetical protein